MRNAVERGDSTIGAVSDLIRGVSESSSRCKFPWILDGSPTRVDNARHELFLNRSVPGKWSIPGIVIVALFAALANPPGNGVTSPADFEYVQRVVDGDTLMLGTGERVRLIGVDTPEIKHPNKPVEYFSKEASAFTQQ